MKPFVRGNPIKDNPQINKANEVMGIYNQNLLNCLGLLDPYKE